MKRSAKPSAPSRRSARSSAKRKPAPRAAPFRRHHHSVYVVELSRDVWGEPRFRRANEAYDITKPCVYVGMTGLSPDVRFDKHMAGIQAARFVTRYGLRLLPQLYEVYNPMPYQAAREMEVELALSLKARGFGVWQG